LFKYKYALEFMKVEAQETLVKGRSARSGTSVKVPSN
jgi:hypothetical protein